ncbi:MAG: hypothetical protein P4L53_19980 [Candidatus Obscuribacterales bacterium]|nr:hypothetical protein [Candidatus Obscuribacterales bacterium]
MSNATALNNFEHSDNLCESSKSADILASEQQLALLMTGWISLGIILGGTVAFFSLEGAVTPFLQSTIMMCTVAGATVGAAVGQLVAGLTHVIFYGGLDE